MSRLTASLGSLSLVLTLAGSATLSTASHAAPGRPAGLQALPAGENEVNLTWEDTADNEAGFQVFARPHGGTFANIGSVGANEEEALVQGLSPGLLYDFRLRAVPASGPASGFSNTASAYTDELIAPPGSCTPGSGICLDNRFRVDGIWRTASGSGSAVPHAITNLSTAFYFFSPNNLEVLLKVLNGCGINNRWWIFFSATTNVEFTIAVTDTEGGIVRRYYNPLDHPATPVQDTSAFATCP